MDNSKKIILDLCGGTGSWSKPYADAGYEVQVITLPDWDVTNRDVKDYCVETKPYGILAAPPCTKFSRAAWNIKKKDRDFKEGMRCVRACMEIIWQVQENGAPLAFWAMENPQGYLYNFMGRPFYWFQPWMFGETGFLATKRTALWGYFNPPVKTTRKRTVPKISTYNAKRAAPTGLTENKAWYSASAEKRAATPVGFARAFFKANQ